MEKEFRKTVFKNNNQKIFKRNKNHKRWKEKANQFAFMTDEEKFKHLGLKIEFEEEKQKSN